MALPVWPLKRPNSTNYMLAPDNAVVRTTVEGGPARQRRRYTQIPTTAQVEWLFDLDEMAVFESFWKNELLDGVAWFEMEILNGQGITTQEVRFKTVWEAEAVGGVHFYVSSVIEIRELPIA